MQLTLNGFRNFLVSGHTVYLNGLRQQLHTYSKKKRVLLLIILLVMPLGLLWVFLIMKTDKKLKNTFSNNGKGKR
jgi:tRNA uridine 5-carbamoylmethylation protein Kti12